MLFINDKGKPLYGHAPIPPYPVGHNMIHCYRKERPMYKIIDEMCCETHEVENYQEAVQLAFNLQAVLVDVEGNILKDYS